MSLNRLFARSMTEGFDLAEPQVAPSPRSSARGTMLIMLAGLLAIVGALAGGYYFAMRPVTLRIAEAAVAPRGQGRLLGTTL